ncbi:Uncharacterized protein ABC855_g4942 [[Candida] zeylanoides]
MLPHTLLQFALLVQFCRALPLPALITRVHTAAAVTQINTYTTGTTTLQLPPVEILISDDCTYTITLTEQPAAAPTTVTTIYHDKQGNIAPAPAAPTTTPAANPAPTTTAANTPNQPAQPTPTTEAATNAAPTEANTAAPTTETTTAAPTEAPDTEAPAVGPTEAATEPTTAPTVAATTPSPTTQAPLTTPTTQNPTTSPTTQNPTTSPTTQNPSTPQNPTTQTKPTTSPTSTPTSGGGIAPPDTIVYSPYTDSGSCKSANTIESDLEYIKSKGINKLRIYGTDCGNWDTILPKCVALGLKVNQGFWISASGVDSIDDSVSEFVAYGQAHGWDVFAFVTIGNEAVSAGYVSASQLVSKISAVKGRLQAAGYKGQVTTSEPPNVFIDHPEICTNSGIDFVGVNAHSYFDPDTTAQDSGPFIVSQKELAIKACNGMSAYITETGYPWKGDTYGSQVPSVSNQQDAIRSIIEATGGDITILTTYNDMWKQPGPHGIEQYFGTITLFT